MDTLSDDSMGSSSEMTQPTKTHNKKSISEDDMTEDEVAVMVKNALRKARRAMHNSSPLNTPDPSNDDDDDDEDDWVDKEYSTPIKKKMNSGDQKVKNITPTRDISSGVADILVDDDDDLAKRIEAEINSARAFAEHAYFGKETTEESNKEEQPPLSPVNAPSVTSDVTEIHANKSTSATQKSQSSPQGYNSRSPRARRKAAIAARNKSSSTSSQQITSPPRDASTNNAALDSPMVDTDAVSDTTSSPNKLSRGQSPRYRKKMNSTKLSPPRTVEKNTSVDDILMPTSPARREDIASDYYKSPDEAEKRKLKQEAEAMIAEKMIHEPPVPEDKPTSPKSHKSSKPSSDNKGLSVNSKILNSKASSYSNSNLTKQQLNGSRQVTFRHPYPLPPPPAAFRSEDIIINENTVPDKSQHVKLVEPDAELEQLIQQSRDGTNIVRRSNACGAIKVLASRGANKAKLARTTGLLDALVYASEDNAVDSDALDARTRAVTALLYLSEPKDNRIIVAKHQGVLEVLVKVIEEDTGEARLRACSTLATLAKTAQNRSVICDTENLAVVLSDLMIVKAAKKQEETEEPEAMEEAVESKSESQDEGTTQDGGSFSNTFSGVSGETDGTGSYTEDDTYADSYGMSEDDGSVYSNDMSMSNERSMSNDRSMSNGGSMSNERSMSNDLSMSNGKTMSTEAGASIGEEEGVEMQMSSLKKLNIENASNFLERSQLSACATLTHLTKHCANARSLCLNEKVLNNILFLAEILEHPLHTRCLEMLCNFTRFPANNAKLASMPRVIGILTAGGKSKLAEDRLWSIRTIQNLCSDASSKVGLATGSLLSLLSACAMRKDYEEQLAAVGALMNLATEPGSIVPLTNTKTVVATLVHLAHSPNTPTPVRKIACDSLATIGLWLQTLASAGTVPDSCPLSPLPTHTATGWLRWDG